MDIVSELGGKEALINFAIVNGAAVVGQVVHYVKQWTRGEVAGNVWAYFMKDHPRRTAATFGTILGSTGAALATGQLDPSHINGLVALVTLGTSFGYAANSAINKGADPDAIKP